MTSTAAENGEKARTGSRSLLVTCLCLAIGAAGALWSLGQPWVTGTTSEPGMPVVAVEVAGTSMYPMGTAGAWLAVAALIGLLATRGVVRQAMAVGAVLAAIMVTTSAVSFGLSDAAEHLGAAAASSATSALAVTGWPILTGIAGLVIFVGGVTAMRASRHWPGLSARQTGTRSRATDRTAWQQIEDGDDPTHDGDAGVARG